MILNKFKRRLVLYKQQYTELYFRVVILVALLQNALLSVCVRVRVCWCVCVCVCVCLHNNSKCNKSRNLKFEYMAVYENISDKF